MSETKFQLGDFDKQTFFQRLRDNLLKIPNLPSQDQTFTTQQAPEGTASILKNLAKARHIQQDEDEEQDDEKTQQQTVAGFMKRNKGTGFKRYMNFFSVDRGSCRLCAQKMNSCIQYRGCYNIESFRGAAIFQCLTCGCPMNSHLKVAPERSFSNLISSFITKRYIQPGHLEFSALVTIYFVDRQRAENFEVDVETFVNVLNEGSFNVYSFYEMSLLDLQRAFVYKHLYSQKQQLSKNKFDNYVAYVDCFLDIINICKDEDLYQLRNRFPDNETVEKFDFFIKILEYVNEHLEQAHDQDKIALVFLLTSKSNNLYSDFIKLLRGTSDYLPTDMTYFYSSKTQYHAFRDALLFFPSFFKFNINTFLVTQRSDEERRKINDTFKDLLDFNNFSILKENFGNVGLETMRNAFKFIPNSDNFLQFCTSESGIILKIVSKVGPQSLTVISQNMPNFYRVSSEEQNQVISDMLCPDLFKSQRIIIIYRPVVVKSCMEDVMNIIWRINDFTQVRKVYRKFTGSEAQFLGQIEGIHPENLGTYTAMMTEGYSLLLLFTRPGAWATAKSLLLGCETGLRIRKSKMLNEVLVEHEVKSGMVFREKLNLQFHNLFEAYTEQNIFRSMREIFNLEEMVLQENINQFSKNVFLDDDDDQVYLAQNPEVKQTTINQEIRKQILKDLSRENYNFFVYATQDELTTEQLASLYMSDCSQVQQTYLIVKSNINLEYENIVTSIQELLVRMNFYIIDSKLIKLQEEQANELIQLVSQYKLPEYLLDQYTLIYSQHPIQIISVAKPGGQYELQSFLSKYTIQFPEFRELPKLVSDIKSYLIPCQNVETFRFISRLISPFLERFDGKLFLDKQIQNILFDDDQEITFKKQGQDEPKLSDKHYILNYILITTIGAELETTKPFQMLAMEFQDTVSDIQNVHIHVTTKFHGQFEIRVGIFNKVFKYGIKYQKLRGQYQLLSWYYAKVNFYFKQRCPITYQYRIFHEEKALLGEFDQIFDCQEFCGRIFLIEIYTQIFKFGKDVFSKLKNRVNEEAQQINKQKQQYKGDTRKTGNQFNPIQSGTQGLPSSIAQISRLIEARSRVISYFWGVKLAKFVKELELILPQEFPNGYGQILATQSGFECQYKIHSDEHDGLPEVEMNRYRLILGRLKQYIRDRCENDPTFIDKLEDLGNSKIKKDLQQSILGGAKFINSRLDKHKTLVEYQINKYYETIFGKGGKENPPSSVIFYLLEDQNLRVVPQQLQLNNLRIVLDKEYITQNNGTGAGFWMDWNYETKEVNRIQQTIQSGDGIPSKSPHNNFVMVHALPSVRSRFRLAANIYYLLQVELKNQKQYDKFLTIDVLLEDSSIRESVDDYNAQFYSIKKIGKVVNPLQNTQLQLNYWHWFKEQFVLDKEKVIDSLIKGFENSYFLEEEIIQQIQAINKENQTKKRPPLPDPLYLEIYLFCMDQIDFYLNDIEENQLQQVRVQKQMIAKYQLMEKCKDKPDQMIELKMIEEQLKIQMDRLVAQRDKFDFYLRSVFDYLLSDKFQEKFFFNPEESELNSNTNKQKEEEFNINFFIDQVQNNLTHLDSVTAEEEMQTQLLNFNAGKAERNFGKEFIPSKRYFLPLEMGNNYKEWGKLDQEQIDSKLKQIKDEQNERAMEQIEQYKDAPFLKEGQKDDIQRNWIESMKYTNIGKFVDTRPDKKKTGIYVDKIKKIDQNIDDKIDKVIQKFMQDKMHNFSKNQ